MSRIILLTAGLLLGLSAFAQDLSLKGFNERFSLVKGQDGKVKLIKLKKAVTKFTIKPFLEQIKSELLQEQKSFMALTGDDKEAEIDEMLYDLGMDLYAKGNVPLEAKLIKEALLNLPNIDVDRAFRSISRTNFWKDFERRLHEAFLFVDPTIVANLEDPRFFYNKNVTYKVVEWALRQAQKQFAHVPAFNIATFVIVRVHEMMLEQRHFHHNMLLHYFQTIPETRLGMTKEEVDRSVSSIFVYRISPINVFESNRAASDWPNYGMDNFYKLVRAGNRRIREWDLPMSRLDFSNIKRLNFGFASVFHEGTRKIYHLHLSAHQLSTKPALAYDYSKPNRVRRDRALLNLAQIGIGFISAPGQLKALVENFIRSIYVEQVRMEGALVGYFESTGDTAMIERIYSQRANFYILR